MRWMKMNTFCIAGVGAGILGVGCGSGDATTDEQGPLNLVLITADTLRADHLQTYGYHRDTAPHIDGLATESLVFDRCFAPIARTTPSHLSLMTGVYPFEHGVSSNFGNLAEQDKIQKAFVSKQALATFARIIEDEVDTAGFVSAAPVNRVTGLASGFKTWGEPEGIRRTGTETNGEVLPWLNTAKAPFFLWVHYMDAHGPYAEGSYPPEGYIDMYSVDEGLTTFLDSRAFPETVDGVHVTNVEPAVLSNHYDGAIRMLDQAVGQLLDGLKNAGHYEDSVIVFLSDHGQGLGQHGYAGHGDVWAEQLQVPLFIRVPGKSPARIDLLMSTIDVIPTALGLDGMFAADAFLTQSRGMNVFDPAFAEPAVFGMGGRQEQSFSLTDGVWKYVERKGGEGLLFRTDTDPFELKDVSESESERYAEMRARLAQEIESQRLANESYGPGNSNETADPKHLEALKALGYTGDE